MPFYTYKCNTCGLEKDFLKSMGESKTQLCPKCCYDPNIQGDGEKMTRIYKPNANILQMVRGDLVNDNI